MPNPTVRVSERAHRLLKELSATTGQPILAVIDSALDAYRRERFIAEGNAGYARLREDEAEWSALGDELSGWEATLSDGLPDERPPSRARGRQTK